MFGIDTARPQKQQLLHIGQMRRVDNIGLNHQVFIDEFGGKIVVGLNATDFCRRQIHLIYAGILKKCLHITL